MIESEEKRKRLTEIITRWTKHTKVDHLLRDGDISGLVHSILEEFYHIQLSCGHYVRELDEATHLKFKDCNVDGIGDEGMVYGAYCEDCAQWYKKKLKAKEVK